MFEVVVLILSKLVSGVAFGAGTAIGSSALKDKAEELKSFLQTRYPKIFGEIQNAGNTKPLLEQSAKQLEETAKKDTQLAKLIEDIADVFKADTGAKDEVKIWAKNIGITGGNFLGDVNQTFH